MNSCRAVSYEMLCFSLTEALLMWISANWGWNHWNMSCFCCTTCAAADLMERKLFCTPTNIFHYSHMEFTWFFFFHAHRMDRTRVLLHWYQAWASKEDKVVWALTTKDLVLIKVIYHLVCSPVSSLLKEGLSQCSAPREKWLQHSAGPWLREKLP